MAGHGLAEQAVCGYVTERDPAVAAFIKHVLITVLY